MNKIKGVSYHKATKRWRVYQNKDGQRIWLGQYKTFDEAVTKAKEIPSQRKPRKIKFKEEEVKIPYKWFYKRLEEGQEVNKGDLILTQEGNLYIVQSVEKVKENIVRGEMKYTRRRFIWEEICQKLICI